MANSIEFYLALHRKDIPSSLHIYGDGEHGYLLDTSFEEWFGRWENWMRGIGIGLNSQLYYGLNE